MKISIYEISWENVLYTMTISITTVIQTHLQTQNRRMQIQMQADSVVQVRTVLFTS